MRPGVCITSFGLSYLFPMVSITARQHADKFFRSGFGNQLLALRGDEMEHVTWLAICDKTIEKRLSHLRGRDFDDAYESILVRLLKKAEDKRSSQSTENHRG